MISRDSIMHWLENYHCWKKTTIQSSWNWDSPPPQNRNPDGKSNREINVLLLDEAIRNIPDEYAQAVVKARYIHMLRTGEILVLLGLSRSSYYRHLRSGIDAIFAYVNKDETIKPAL